INTQSSVQSSAIALRLFLASRSPNTSWRLRLMRVSTVSGTALSILSLNDCASPVLATTRKRAESGAQFLDEYGGLLKGREMSAVGGFVPIEESRIDPLAPQSRRLEHFARENAHGDRQIEPLRREICRETLIVEARGGCGRVGEPIERDVVEHLVARDFPLRFVVAVGPLTELFVDPRRLAGGRVRQRVADGLRPGGLYLGVSG